MIKMKGKILELGTVDTCNRMFAEDCNIKFPEMIPVVNGAYEPFDEDYQIIGNCRVSRDGNVLTGDVNIYGDYENCVPYKKEYIGGYYTMVEVCVNSDGIRVVSEANLHHISIIPLSESADESLYLEKVGE